MEATRAMIPIVLFICAATTLFGIFYLRNKENMALIERGINPRESYRKFGSLAYLKYALMMIGAGIGLLIAYLIDINMITRGFGVGPQHPALYFSLIPICAGIGLVLSYNIEKKEMQKYLNKE
ncbi:MAG: DUF6249 domain-containing protein [Flavipsychrobacter sp.]